MRQDCRIRYRDIAARMRTNGPVYLRCILLLRPLQIGWEIGAKANDGWFRWESLRSEDRDEERNENGGNDDPHSKDIFRDVSCGSMIDWISTKSNLPWWSIWAIKKAKFRPDLVPSGNPPSIFSSPTTNVLTILRPDRQFKGHWPISPITCHRRCFVRTRHHQAHQISGGACWAICWRRSRADHYWEISSSTFRTSSEPIWLQKNPIFLLFRTVTVPVLSLGHQDDG